MTIPELIAMPIKTRPEAEAFIAALFAARLGYHFDDGAVDCLHGNNLCTVEEAEAIEEQVNACYMAFEWSNADMANDCPIGHALKVMELAA
jgi:alkylation response protein AidB-like acyl-CoA dehydrogenase